MAWAVTMVNVRNPEVFRHFLLACRGSTIGTAVSNGIVSALMVWKHMGPSKENPLLSYMQESSLETADGSVWNELVTEPAVYAFDAVFPALAGLQGPAIKRSAACFDIKTYRNAGGCGCLRFPSRLAIFCPAPGANFRPPKISRGTRQPNRGEPARPPRQSRPPW